MLTIRYVQLEDKEQWYRLDRQLPKEEFAHKVQTKRGYVLCDTDKLIGVLRYALFLG